jgi:hypothetical protein
MADRSPADLAVAGAVFGWITLVLLVDRHAGLPAQRLLGVATWLVLIGLLRRESPLVRVQVGIVVAFATLIEYTFSPLLGVYVYRLHNVPAFVPPGHGLVYLCALTLGRTRWLHRCRSACTAATVVIGGAYASWGLFRPRHDMLGAFWFVCLVGFLCLGRSRTLYVGAFAIVTYLELIGTGLGTWAWQPYDPLGIVSIGNPPSGAAGGYGWFDLAALFGAPGLLVGLRNARAALCSAPLLARALPPAGPGRPPMSVNSPPASVTINETAARSCSATSGSAARSTVPSASNT